MIDSRLECRHREFDRCRAVAGHGVRASGRVFFFFQAEDGIRDLYVTGVQTCALPISACTCRCRSRRLPAGGAEAVRITVVGAGSEERRVGKECRSRWTPYHVKKK